MSLIVLILIFALLIAGNIAAFKYIPGIANVTARWVLIVAVVVVDVIIVWRLLDNLGIPDVRV